MHDMSPSIEELDKVLIGLYHRECCDDTFRAWLSLIRLTV